MNIELDARYSQPQRVEFFRNLFARVEALPGVQKVGGISNLPLSNSEDLREFEVDGYPNKKGQLAEFRWATPQYFSAMGIPLAAGRLFTQEDKSNRSIAIVNESFANKYFNNRNQIGARVSRDDDHTQ